MTGLAVRCLTSRPTAVLALGSAALLTVTACASPRVATFRPAGATSRDTPSPSSPAGAGPAAGPGSGGFRFPASFAVTFQAAPPGGAVRRAVLAGYEDYARAFWSAIISHGRDHRYRRYLAGNALAFARSQIRYYSAHGLTVRGTARYFDVRVTNVYFGNGAVVAACVDVSALTRVDIATGRRAGAVYSHRYLHYLEEVTEGRLAGGGWNVIRTSSYPATTSEGAMCR